VTEAHLQNWRFTEMPYNPLQGSRAFDKNRPFKLLPILFEYAHAESVKHTKP